jgi:hypothetical protein
MGKKHHAGQSESFLPRWARSKSLWIRSPVAGWRETRASCYGVIKLTAQALCAILWSDRGDRKHLDLQAWVDERAG